MKRRLFVDVFEIKGIRASQPRPIWLVTVNARVHIEINKINQSVDSKAGCGESQQEKPDQAGCSGRAPLLQQFLFLWSNPSVTKTVAWFQ